MAIASIYLDPTAAAEKENDARIVHALAWARGLGHGCWAIAGDWNRHPSLLRHDLLSQMGAAVVAPAAPTCHSSNGPPSCIDWWVVGPDLAARSPAADVWDETGLPTHRPVELRISGPQRSLEITALRRPVALPPPDKPADDKSMPPASASPPSSCGSSPTALPTWPRPAAETTQQTPSPQPQQGSP